MEIARPGFNQPNYETYYLEQQVRWRFLWPACVQTRHADLSMKHLRLDILRYNLHSSKNGLKCNSFQQTI